jgi:hypothetical protein
MKPIDEDAPVNCAGGGAVAGIGVGLKGEPPAGRLGFKAFLKRKRKNVRN